MRSYTLSVAILLGITGWSWAQAMPSNGPRFATPLRPMIEALHSAKVPGSLELSRCGSPPLPQFPHLQAQTTRGRSLIQILSEMFADDPIMGVTQDNYGMIRMIESGVSPDLLNVKIKHIPFEINGVPLQHAAFSPVAAVGTILHTPEVLAYAEAHNIVIPSLGGAAPGNNAPFSIDRPHIVGSMDNLTLSQALDRVLRTFPGIWVYAACPCADGKGSCVFLRFLNIKDPGLVQE
jgi:hypothetical protein